MYTLTKMFFSKGRTAVSDLVRESREIVRKAFEDATEKMKNQENQLIKDEIASKIKEQSLKFNAVMEDFMKNVNGQIKNNPSVSSAYESVQNKIKETTSTLNKFTGSGSGDFKKITDEFKTSWTNITNEMVESYSKIDFRKIKEEELEPLYKNALDKITSIAKELEKSIDEITKKNNK